MPFDTQKRCGTITKAFHWLMALLVGWQLLKFGDRIAEGEHWVGQVLVPWHVSVGVLLLAFAALIVGHIAMAMFHHLIKRDDTLARMTRSVPIRTDP